MFVPLYFAALDFAKAAGAAQAAKLANEQAARFAAEVSSMARGTGDVIDVEARRVSAPLPLAAPAASP